MKKRGLFIVLLLSFVVLFANSSFAQRGINLKGSGGWGPGTSYNRMYDTKTVETVEGEVVSVGKITPVKGMYSGIHLMVKTGTETISVHLGPSWYLENQDLRIEPKDKVQIKGSRITYEGKPALIAADIKKGEDSLKLRDEAGFLQYPSEMFRGRMTLYV